MPNQQDLCIEQEAIKWFVRVRSDEHLAESVAEFQVWFHADAAHSQAYREIEALWALLGQFDGQPAVIAACRESLNKGDLLNG